MALTQKKWMTTFQVVAFVIYLTDGKPVNLPVNWKWSLIPCSQFWDLTGQDL